jgi:multicomponent Na+:H+ antiporter subunit G
MAQVLVIAGCALTLLAAVGVVRFDDVFARMHALSKASTVGLLLVLAGAAVGLSSANDITSLVLAGILQVLTMPVGANLVARATYRGRGIPTTVDTIDELAEHEEP